MERTIRFIKEVYEYFRNDYSLIIEFLSMDSPWDKHFLGSLNISKEELDVHKFEMQRSITQTYKNNIINRILETKKVRLVDKRVFDQFINGQSLDRIFFSDTDSNVTMQKLFFKFMKKKYGFKESTYHKFKRNIWDVSEIYNSLYDRFGLEEILENYQDNPLTNELLSKTEDAFDINLYVQTIHYFNNYFRDQEEEKEFLNYLFSICYANMIYEKVKGTIKHFSGVEEAIKTVVENNIDTHDCFYYNPQIGVTLISMISAMCYSFKEKYDLRKSIKDDEIQSYFRALDDNYDTEYEPDIMIYDFSIDKKLEEILDYMLKNDGIDTVYEILIGDDSIYDVLFEHGLDPRYEDFFKKLLRHKIMGDALEAELYYRKHETRATFPHVERLKEIRNNEYGMYGEFYGEGDELLSIYAYYHNEKEYVREQARIEAYNAKELPYIMRLNPYAHYNYIHIASGDIVALDSVNKISEIFDLNVESMLKALLTNPSYISLVVMNVYENMLQEPSDDGLIKELINTIEQNEDITDYMINHRQQLLSIVKLFKEYNGDELSNKNELGLRSNIQEESKKKVLRRLNPFEEEDKKQ